MNIKIKYIIGMFVLMLAFTACDKTFEEVNANVNSPEDVTVNVLMPQVQHAIFDNFGRGFDRYAGTFTQHFAGNHATGVDLDNYIMNNSTFEAFFTDMYSVGMKDAKEMVETATALEANQYIGVGKIMQAIPLGYLTDIYGDIPWSEALSGGASDGNPYPKYDTQESIYNEIQKLLSDGITELEKPLFGRELGDDDLVFGGDIKSWIAYAHVLKARYHNHLSKRDPAGSATSALASITAAEMAGLTSETNLMFTYDGGALHQNPWYSLYLNNLIIASESFMNSLIANGDPRLEAYWDDTNTDGVSVGYTGKTSGLGISALSFAPVGPDGFFGKDVSPLLIATYFEAKFIEAEAALRAGNAARAAAAHNAGVAASINLVVSHADGLARVAAYTATYGSETAASITLSKVMNEKYKAMFCQGIEAWTDARRHDFSYPSTLAVPAGAMGSGDFPRRSFYPQDELDKNTSTPLGVTQFDKLWWDN